MERSDPLPSWRPGDSRDAVEVAYFDNDGTLWSERPNYIQLDFFVDALALLIDHDDAEREFHYASTAQTFAEAEPITDVGARRGWSVTNMAQTGTSYFRRSLDRILFARPFTAPRPGCAAGRHRCSAFDKVYDRSVIYRSVI